VNQWVVPDLSIVCKDVKPPEAARQFKKYVLAQVICLHTNLLAQDRDIAT